MRLIDADALLHDPCMQDSYCKAAIRNAPTVDQPLRPCIIGNKGKKTKAFFHTWATYAEPISPSPMVGGHAGGHFQYPVAIVELEDGGIAQVSPTTIRFTDREEKQERKDADRL